MKNRTQKAESRKQGFTLLLSVLIGSLLLSLGLAVFALTLKELLLSSAGRESQFAFYAADSGIECALYWDQKGGAFSTSTSSSINCNGLAIPGMGGAGYDVPSAFSLTFAPEPYCANVSVTKTLVDGVVKTNIESKGYNTCASGAPRRVERAIRVTY